MKNHTLTILETVLIERPVTVNEDGNLEIKPGSLDILECLDGPDVYCSECGYELSSSEQTEHGIGDYWEVV